MLFHTTLPLGAIFIGVIRHLIRLLIQWLVPWLPQRLRAGNRTVIAGARESLWVPWIHIGFLQTLLSIGDSAVHGFKGSPALAKFQTERQEHRNQPDPQGHRTGPQNSLPDAQAEGEGWVMIRSRNDCMI